MTLFESKRDSELYLVRAENVCNVHLHRSVELLYVLCGEKKVKLGNRVYRLTKNDLLVCPPYQAHIYYASENSKQIVATVFTDFCPQFYAICQNATPRSHVYHDTTKELLPLFEQLEKKPNDVLFCGLINHILGIFTQNTTFERLETRGEQELAEQIVEYVDKHYPENLTLATLSKKFGYSPNYFSTLFHQCLGIGLSQYVNSVRIQKSLPFLQEKSVESLAYECGFNSPQQYYLNFKKIHSCSPKEYLHKH